MDIPFLDLSVRDPDHKRELLDAIAAVLDHGRILMGPEHDQFEVEVAKLCGRRFGVGVGSGTDALYLGLRALDIGPGDEVITTPLTWVATTNAVVLCGATPVFVDIADDLNMNPDLIEDAITPRTKAILPVHFTGLMCDMERIEAIAKKHGLIVVEDAAQAFGARLGDRPAGSWGRLSCFSMNPMKVLAAYGEAGAVATDDEALAERLRSLRYAGTVNRENCREPSVNGRLDTVQAAMLLVNLRRLDARIEARRRVAALYNELLSDVVKTPIERPGDRHGYYSYTVLAEGRDGLRDHLADVGIETKVLHPYLMHKHDAYRERFKANVPMAEALVEKILCLPAHQDMADDAVARVAEAVRAHYGGGGA